VESIFDRLFETPDTVTIDHGTQMFEINGIRVDRHQVLRLTVALASYYRNREFIDSKGTVLNVKDYLGSLIKMR
jgi:hypothetical protein